MTDPPILTTKECVACGYVFSRYLDHRAGVKAFEPKKEQRWCPQCDRAHFVVEVEHPGESL